MKRFILTILASVLIGEGSMAAEMFTTLDPESSNEWVFENLISNRSGDAIADTIESVLDKAIESTIETVKEEEVDEFVHNYLKMVENLYRDGLMTKEQYDAELSTVNHESARDGLYSSSAKLQLEDGIAAAEYLSAMLGFPTSSFNSLIDSHGDGIRSQYTMKVAEFSQKTLLRLVPKALIVVHKASSEESIEVLGLHGEPERISWLSSLGHLRINLEHSLSAH